MSKISKLPFNHLLIKIDHAKYKTPCETYIIEYTNYGYYDNIHWVAKKYGIDVIVGETLKELVVKIVEKNPFMDTKLYCILYGVKKED